tara:strand:+ start:1101 stop:1301 length:201 start_codon:yes stop_codon:yes gene_type:complete
MSLTKVKGYFYNNDGDLIESYIGHLNLDDMDEVLEYRKNAVGFIETELVNTEVFKYDLETQTIVEI